MNVDELGKGERGAPCGTFPVLLSLLHRADIDAPPFLPYRCLHDGQLSSLGLYRHSLGSSLPLCYVPTCFLTGSSLLQGRKYNRKTLRYVTYSDDSSDSDSSSDDSSDEETGKGRVKGKKKEKKEPKYPKEKNYEFNRVSLLVHHPSACPNPI